MVPKAVEVTESQKIELAHCARASPHPEDVKLGRVPAPVEEKSVAEQLKEDEEAVPLGMRHIRSGKVQSELRNRMEETLMMDRKELDKNVSNDTSKFRQDIQFKRLLGYVVGGAPTGMKVRHANKVLQGPRREHSRPMLTASEQMWDMATMAAARVAVSKGTGRARPASVM